MRGNKRQGWSRHAVERASQRAIRQAAVDATVTWGSEIHQRGGRTALFIDRAAIKRAWKESVDIACWAGTALVVGLDGGAITAIQSDDLRRLRRFGWRRPGRRARR